MMCGRFAVDFPTGKYLARKNNVWVNSSNPATELLLPVYVSLHASDGWGFVSRNGVFDQRIEWRRLDPPVHRRQPEIRAAVWVSGVG